jgi:signal transduction histidine kinase
VRNAIIYSPEGGRISISAHVKADRLHLLIADEGKGVSDSDLVAIFSPFFRSGSVNSPAGYGLGLAITRRVIQAHGGSVMAANQPEGGLVVTVELPKPSNI